MPLPTAPLHLTSIHGRPEHISTTPLKVAVPVVVSVEKVPGACASGLPGIEPTANAMRTAATAEITPLPQGGRGASAAVRLPSRSPPPRGKGQAGGRAEQADRTGRLIPRRGREGAAIGRELDAGAARRGGPDIG